MPYHEGNKILKTIEEPETMKNNNIVGNSARHSGIIILLWSSRQYHFLMVHRVMYSASVKFVCQFSIVHIFVSPGHFDNLLRLFTEEIFIVTSLQQMLRGSH